MTNIDSAVPATSICFLSNVLVGSGQFASPACVGLAALGHSQFTSSSSLTTDSFIIIPVQRLSTSLALRARVHVPFEPLDPVFL